MLVTMAMLWHDRHYNDSQSLPSFAILRLHGEILRHHPGLLRRVQKHKSSLSHVRTKFGISMGNKLSACFVAAADEMSRLVVERIVITYLRVQVSTG